MLVKIVPSHLHLVAEYQETILSSVDDPIRMWVLELVSEMVFLLCIMSLFWKVLYLTLQVCRKYSIDSLPLNHPTPSQPIASQALSLLSPTVSMTSYSTTSPLLPLTLLSYWNLLIHRILSLTLCNRYVNIEDFE